MPGAGLEIGYHLALKPSEPRQHRRRTKPSLCSSQASYVAEGAGFEPAIRFPVYTLSRRAPSTTRPPLLTFWEPPQGVSPLRRRSPLAQFCAFCAFKVQSDQLSLLILQAFFTKSAAAHKARLRKSAPIMREAARASGLCRSWALSACPERREGALGPGPTRGKGLAVSQSSRFFKGITI